MPSLFSAFQPSCLSSDQNSVGRILAVSSIVVCSSQFIRKFEFINEIQTSFAGENVRNNLSLRMLFLPLILELNRFVAINHSKTHSNCHISIDQFATMENSPFECVCSWATQEWWFFLTFRLAFRRSSCVNLVSSQLTQKFLNQTSSDIKAIYFTLLVSPCSIETSFKLMKILFSHCLSVSVVYKTLRRI